VLWLKAVMRVIDRGGCFAREDKQTDESGQDREQDFDHGCALSPAWKGYVFARTAASIARYFLMADFEPFAWLNASLHPNWTLRRRGRTPPFSHFGLGEPVWPARGVAAFCHLKLAAGALGGCGSEGQGFADR